jgi:hypothetical protein
VVQWGRNFQILGDRSARTTKVAKFFATKNLV